MLKTWNAHALTLAAGAALILGAAPPAHAEVAGGVIGCDAPGGKQIAGALIGGVLGGVAGNNIIKKDQQAGTIVGAAAGAAAGSYVGCQMQKRDGHAPPPPPSRARYDEAPDAYVVREAPPRVVYETPPPRVIYEPAPSRTVIVREVEEGHRHKGRHGPGWARRGYDMPPGHAKRYLIGQRMPVAYVRERQYIIVEPTRYRLRPAPVGYRWVMYGGDSYLVGVETGLISQVVRELLG